MRSRGKSRRKRDLALVLATGGVFLAGVTVGALLLRSFEPGSGQVGTAEPALGRRPSVRGSQGTIPKELMSESIDGSDPQGFAMLFDLEAGEIIIDDCRPHRYFSASGNVVHPRTWGDPCRRLLTARIVGASGRSLTLDAKERPGTVEFPFRTFEEGGRFARLEWSWEGKQYPMVAGSRNDIYQRLMSHGVVQAERERFDRLVQDGTVDLWSDGKGEGP